MSSNKYVIKNTSKEKKKQQLTASSAVSCCKEAAVAQLKGFSSRKNTLYSFGYCFRHFNSDGSLVVSTDSQMGLIRQWYRLLPITAADCDLWKQLQDQTRFPNTRKLLRTVYGWECQTVWDGRLYCKSCGRTFG